MGKRNETSARIVAKSFRRDGRPPREFLSSYYKKGQLGIQKSVTDRDCNAVIVPKRETDNGRVSLNSINNADKKLFSSFVHSEITEVSRNLMGV